MSYLLFMDESGHDHGSAPFEVRGGICVHARKVWPLTQKVKGLEFFAFGDHLHNYKSSSQNDGPELKGKKLLKRKKFTLASQQAFFDHADRQDLSRKLLGKGVRNETPTRAELTSYAQACLYFCDELLRVLVENGAKIFASRIPNGTGKPKDASPELLRKDQFFLYERFDRFLRSRNETGLLIMDQSDKDLDRRYVRSLERLFTGHEKARAFAETIVPSPIFMDSEMSYLIQTADIILYLLNWGVRLAKNDPCPARGELVALDNGRVRSMIDRRRESGADGFFYSYSVFDVRDPWSTRPREADKEKEGNAFEAVFRAPSGPSLRLMIAYIPHPASESNDRYRPCSRAHESR